MEKISTKKLIVTVFRSIGLYIKRNPGIFSLATIATIFIAISSYLQLIVFSKIINIIVQTISHHSAVSITAFINPLLLFLVLLLLPGIFASLKDWCDTVLRENILIELQILRAKRFSQLDIATVESDYFQSTLQRVQEWGLSTIQNMYSFYVNILTTAASVIFAIFLISTIDYRLVILAVISAVPIYFIDAKFSRALFTLRYFDTGDRRVGQDRFAHFTTPRLLIDVIQNKISPIFIAEAEEKYKSAARKIITLQSTKSWFEALNAFFVALCSITAIYLIIHLTIIGLISIGALFVAYSSYSSFRSSISNFLENISTFQESGRYANDWFALLDLESELKEPAHPVFIDPHAPLHIVFENISFRYPEKDTDTLSNISFEIKPGEKMAFVGHNGAGKTTLIRLLTRVYDPTEGRILVNGIDLKEVSMDNWRDCVAVMQQDFVNYNLLAKDSITIAQRNHEEEINEEKMLKASTLSGSNDFIEEFPKKYDQLIWKGYKDGVSLSRGQFQRLAVARTFYRNSSLYVFDEPTAAIDALAEEKIFNAIETQMKDKTVVLISHRFSTVKNADTIIFLEHGRIVEMGNHQELMAQKGRYEALFTMQANRYLEEE